MLAVGVIGVEVVGDAIQFLLRLHLQQVSSSFAARVLSRIPGQQFVLVKRVAPTSQTDVERTTAVGGCETDRRANTIVNHCDGGASVPDDNGEPSSEENSSKRLRLRHFSGVYCL